MPETRASTAHYRRTHQWRMWLQGLLGSRYDRLANFHVVEPGMLYRCGQPRIRDLEWIRREHGLRTIFCTRGGTRHPLRGRWYRKETAWCDKHGVRFIHRKFSDAAAPPPEIFDEFLQVVRDPANQPVLVHCEQGWHRTGILAAAYRVAERGWSVDAAWEELARLGFETTRAKRQPLLEAFLTWTRQHEA